LATATEKWWGVSTKAYHRKGMRLNTINSKGLVLAIRYMPFTIVILLNDLKFVKLLG